MKKKASEIVSPAMRNRTAHAAGAEVPAVVDEAALLIDLRDLIQSARQRIAFSRSITSCMQSGGIPASKKPETSSPRTGRAFV